MPTDRPLDRIAFASSLAALGILTLVVGDFAMGWQPVPTWVPLRQLVAYVSGAVLVATSIGVLIPRTARLASTALLVYTALWVVLLKLSRVIVRPGVEGNWLGLGEIAVVLFAAWVLFARDHGIGAATSGRGVRLLQHLFGLALIPVGLSHFVYYTQSLTFVPRWLPFHGFWVYFTGAAHIAAGVAVLVGVVPYLAATLEAVMIGVFTVAFWLPGVIAAPTERLQWTAGIISWVIGAGAWVVAGMFAPAHGDEGEGVRAPNRAYKSVNEQSSIGSAS